MAEVSIWIVNGDHWPRSYLRAELIERGYDAIGFVTLEDALERLELTRSARPALLVLDRHDQAADGERTWELLRHAGVPVLAVADLAHPGGAHAEPIVEVLHRPLTIGDVANAVDRLTRRAVRPR